MSSLVRRKLTGCATYCSSDKVSVKEEEEEDEEEVDEDLVVFDERDKIWRCINCQWEIEADDEANGYCQCRIDENLSGKSSELLNVSDVLSGSRELRRKPLVNVYINSDYGPADSDSSFSDSSESEPDSSDEQFLDDGDIVVSVDSDPPPAPTQSEDVPSEGLSR